MEKTKGVDKINKSRETKKLSELKVIFRIFNSNDIIIEEVKGIRFGKWIVLQNKYPKNKFSHSFKTKTRISYNRDTKNSIYNGWYIR